MKIIVLKENLKKAFSNVEKATGSSALLPILKNILLKTEKGQIKLAATDLEIAITQFINGKIVDEGGITVPANILGGLLNNLPDNKIELEVIDSKLKIKSENSENFIQGIKENDFPIIPQIQLDNYLEIKNKILKKSLYQIISAAAPSDRRPEINGVLFWLKNNTLKLVATDTFRLAEKTLTEDSFKTNLTELKIIIPLKTIQEFLKIEDEDEEKIKIYFDPHQILFQFSNISFISRLIEGNFPDYEAIIPSQCQTSIIVNKEELIKAVKLASVFVSKINDIRIQISSEKKILISSQDVNIGEAKSEIDAEIEGEKQNLVVNWHYLLDGLKGIDSSEIFLGLNGEVKPILIRSLEEDKYLYLLMPIKNY